MATWSSCGPGTSPSTCASRHRRAPGVRTRSAGGDGVRGGRGPARDVRVGRGEHAQRCSRPDGGIDDRHRRGCAAPRRARLHHGGGRQRELLGHAGVPFAQIDIDAADLDDSVAVAAAIPATILGGEGDDRMGGGAGDDSLRRRCRWRLRGRRQGRRFDRRARRRGRQRLVRPRPRQRARRDARRARSRMRERGLRAARPGGPFACG